MKVYVLTKGAYEGRAVVGVYSSPEKAFAAHPEVGEIKWRQITESPADWDYHGPFLGFDKCADIEEYELQ